MTSKTELKELIESLRDEIRGLKSEIEVLKTLVVNNNSNVIYPYFPISEPKITYTEPYNDPNTTGATPYPKYPTITISTTQSPIITSNVKTFSMHIESTPTNV